MLLLLGLARTDSEIGRSLASRLAGPLLGDELSEPVRYPQDMGSEGGVLCCVDTRDRELGGYRGRHSLVQEALGGLSSFWVTMNCHYGVAAYYVPVSLWLCSNELER